MSNYPKVPETYMKVFDFTVNQSGQDSASTIPFLSVYMEKTDIFSDTQRLRNLLTTISKLLSNPKTLRWGLDIADSVLRNESIAENHQVPVEVFKLILQTLNSGTVQRFIQKDFCRLLVNFIIKHNA